MLKIRVFFVVLENGDFIEVKSRRVVLESTDRRRLSILTSSLVFLGRLLNCCISCNDLNHYK